MRTLILLPLALAILALDLHSAHALPFARYSWDQCDPVVTNKNWAGPATYVQVISAVGLTPGIRAINLTVNTGATADAWNFSDGQGGPDCQPTSRLTISSTGADCVAAPVVQFLYRRQIWITQPDKGGFYLTATFDPGFAPDPAVRYAVSRLAFDHSHSVVGPAPPLSGNCGSVEMPVCFGVSGPQYTDATVGPNWIPLAMDSDFLTWQDFNAQPFGRPCPAAVPARPSTWGQIKGQYR